MDRDGTAVRSWTSWMRQIIQSSVTQQDNEHLSMEQNWPVHVLMICRCCWQNLSCLLTCPRLIKKVTHHARCTTRL